MTTLRNALLLGLLLAPLAQADEPKPDEVVIEANRANLVKLGKEIRLAEFRFYKRYNDLNTKREYAIQCESVAATGSRFVNDRCQPYYKTKAEAEEGQQFLLSISKVPMQSWNAPKTLAAIVAAPPPEPTALGGGTPANVAVAAGRPAYQKNVVEVTAANPELQRMLEEHQRLWKQWEAMYYKVNGRKVPGTDDSK